MSWIIGGKEIQILPRDILSSPPPFPHFLSSPHLYPITHKLTPNQEHFQRLRAFYPPPAILIVSNTSGTPSMDPTLSSAALLTANTQVAVLSHKSKKPGCGPEILAHFRAQEGLADLRPEEVAVVGDRLATDAVMANRMGSYGVWVREGVVERQRKSVFARWEGGLYEWLVRRGVRCPVPRGREGEKSPFE